MIAYKFLVAFVGFIIFFAMCMCVAVPFIERKDKWQKKDR